MGREDEQARRAGPAAMLGVAVYLAYFDRSMPSAGAALLKRELAVGDARLGFAVATAAALAYALVAAGAALTGGRHADRWHRHAMPVGMAVWTAGAAALAFAATWCSFVAAELLVGAGQALFVPGAAARLANMAKGERLARASARFTLASTAGRSSAVLIAGAIIAAITGWGMALPGLPADWRALFLLTAIPNLLVLGAPMRRHAGGAAMTEAAETAPDEAAAPGWAAHAGCFATATAPIVVIHSIGVWYPVLLVRVAGLEPARAAMLAGMATLICATFGQWLGGRLLDRRRGWRDRPVRINAPAIAVAGGLIAAFATAGTGAAIVVLAIADVALGVATVAGLTAVQAITSPGARRRGNSLFFALVTLVGVGLGPLLTGVLSDGGGASGAALAHGIGWIAVAALLLAIAGDLLGRDAMRYRAAGGAA
jgi:MFS family permease